MDAKQCFEQSCTNEVHYVCKCSSPATYSCEFHFGKHCKLPNRAHNFESIFLESCEGTKDAVLGFLAKEKSKKDKLKHKILSSFSQHLCSSENSLEEYVKKLDSESAVISSCFEKISQTKIIPIQEQDPLLKLLTLQPDVAVESLKTMVPINSSSHSSIKLFCGLSEEIERIIENSIKEKVERFLGQKLLIIENKLEEHDKIIKEKLEEVNQLISKLAEENEKNKTEFENWIEKIQLKTQNQVVVLISEFNSAVEELEIK
ncbi:unnamed protein product [Blepharisma stoltei]|uniref:Uncharacterized protein n=1 Tax=Blepharisma stoltei TaxID=1481888 RepID=A0AAU9JX88_9CILI|nr:unnamed protein product [Blepharisma stoltei]